MRLLVLLVAVSAGCLSQVTPSHGEAVPDDSAVRQMLATSDFQTLDFVQVNKTAYETAIADAQPALVNIYVDVGHAAEYEAISPETDTPGTKISPGLVVVREALDPQTLAPQLLTVMVRHEDGWFPDGGDFLFGVTDLAGTPMNDPHAGLMWGPLETCASCHKQRAQDGFMFGVTQKAR